MFNRRYGVETTSAMLERMYGHRNDQIVHDYFGEHLTDAEVAARGAAKEVLYREMLGSRLEETLVPGVRAFLDRFRDAPLALASNAEPQNVDFVLDRAGLRAYFRAIVDGHQVSHPKPHPEMYLRAAELLEIAPQLHRAGGFAHGRGGGALGRNAGYRVSVLLTLTCRGRT